jgi:hypothetical protein
MPFLKLSGLTSTVNPGSSSSPKTRSSRLSSLPLSLVAIAGFLVACRTEPADKEGLIVASTDSRAVSESSFDSQSFSNVIGIAGGAGGAAAGPGSPGPVMGKYGGRVGGLGYLGGGRPGLYGMSADGAGGEVYGELDLRGFIPTQADSRRTFAVDVDTAG